MNSESRIAQHPIEQLCPTCGLCCNGVLFGDVEVGRKDRPAQLPALGLSLLKKGRKQAFVQPCVCFDGKFCRIYQDRPERCRTFECGVLKRYASGEITLRRAQGMIQQVYHRVQTILELMRHLGNSEEHLALNRRYAQLMAQPIDLSEGEDLVEQRAQLMLEVDKLMKVVLRDFLA